jgi:LPS-assembly protein
MSSRTRFLITAALVCHVFPASLLVTSRLLSASTTASAPPGEEVTIRALEQEKAGTVYKLRGQAEIHYRSWVLYADATTYDSATGEATAEGHVVLDGGPNDEHIEASRGSYNLRSENGRFYNVVGTTGAKLRGSRVLLTSSNPFAFTGNRVEKTGPGHYVVHDGTVTSCDLPHPSWQFSAGRVVVDVGGNARLYKSVFRVRGVPVFFFPYATHPVERLARQSGFLMPNFGHSSRKGVILGESFFWAINRSMDATLGAEYYSRRGWAQHGAFHARPSETSSLDFTYYGVQDRGFGPAKVDQGGVNVRLKAEARLPHNFRGVANIDYLSSYVFRLAFNEVFSLAVNSEVKSTAFLANTTRGFSYNLLTERYQNFQSTNPGDVITILHAPSLEISGVDRRLGRSPFYWSFDAAAEGLSRSEPAFRTANLIGRFDLHPRLALPLQWKGWTLRPELGLRDTLYTQELSPARTMGVAVDDPVNRKALEATVEMRSPSLSRVFDREVFGRKLKHVVEPRLVYRYVTGVNNFSTILRFDARDILSNTNEVEYGVINRLYAKRISQLPEDCSPQGMPIPQGALTGVAVAPHAARGSAGKTPCPAGPRVREIITWELAQKYFLDPNFGGALVNGRRNVFTTTADFTGIAFLTSPRHLAPLISRLRLQTSARTDAEWDLDYDFRKGRINSSAALVSYHLGEFTIGGSDNYLQSPGDLLLSSGATAPQSFHQFRVLLGYGHPNKRGFSAATNLGFDARRSFLQYGAVQATYNWGCCGVSVEYRRFALGSVRNENQFRFTFGLANIGGFGNLKRQERLF